MDRSELSADIGLKRALLQRVPAESREWVDALVAEAEPETLRSFLFWHSDRSVGAIFSRTPPWPPPSWRTFVQHGLPDWMPVDHDANTYLAAEEVLELRRRAAELGGYDDPLHVAYRVFAWVHRRIRWRAVWGTASPREILDRKSGGSFHLAQLCCMLLRSVFIPARIVEEVAFAPANWVESADVLWHEAPELARRWLGNGILYHPFCEARIGKRWIPFDAQRAQFGWPEMLQHIRTPGLLKLVTRTWEDYGPFISRTERYTIHPLGLTDEKRDTDLRTDLASVERLLGRDLGQNPPKLDAHRALTDRIRKAAWNVWLKSRPGRRFSVESSKDLSSVAEAYLRAGAPAPLQILSGEASPPPGVQETRILLGPAVRRATEPAYLRKIEDGAHLVVLLDAWGSGEPHAQELLAFLGGRLGPWLFPPGSPALPARVKTTGALYRGRRDPDILDLRLVRSLEGLDPGVGVIELERENSVKRRVIAWRSARGKGAITLAPAALAARGDPYTIDFTAGCHRRTMLNLLRLRADVTQEMVE